MIEGMEYTPETLAEEWLRAKKAAKFAADALLLVELELFKLIPPKDEGSSTHNLNGFKVELKGNINRTVDWPLFDMIVKDLLAENPEFPVPEKKSSRALDDTGIKWLAKEMPGPYSRLAKSITAKPGKTGVTVTRTE